MSQETKIDSLSGGISDEDAKLVDSILNDLQQAPPQQQQQQQQMQGQMQGQPQQQPQQMQGQQQMTPEQQQQQQMQMMQMQQHQMQQQQQQQQQQQMQGQRVVETAVGPGIADSIRKEAKTIMIIIFLSIVFNLGQVDSLFKKVGMFVEEGGGLNMQCVFIKALLIGSIFFVIKSQLL
jgi:hypothetical protein